MTMPRRKYVVERRRGKKLRYFYAETLDEAITAAGLFETEAFDYGVFERANRVECEYTGLVDGVVRYRELTGK